MVHQHQKLTQKDSNFNINRNKARSVDKRYDFDLKMHDDHQQELDKLTAPITISELLYHANNLGNNEKTYDFDDNDDDLHAQMLKCNMHETAEIFLITFNH